MKIQMEIEKSNQIKIHAMILDIAIVLSNVD